MATRSQTKSPGPPKPRADKPKAPSKAQTTALISEKTGLSKAQVASVLDALAAAVAESLRKNKQFAVPGLVKITLVSKKATPSRPGRNPFTGEAITIKAKPAHNVVRVRALKALKDLA